MKSDWFTRLLDAIERDPRSYREISIAAKCGVNYVQQMVTNGKEPGGDRLAKILDALGGPTALYVLTGVDANEQDLEMLRILNRLPPAAKEQAILLFQTLQADEGT